MPRTRPRGRPKKPNRRRDIRCKKVYHVYQRGSRGQRAFHSDLERALYVQQLFLVAKRYRVRVHHFVLMQTHIHLVLEQTRKFAISSMMRDLQSNHARKVHQRLETYGHLWMNSFRIRQVTSETYYQTLLWYLSHNPVKAGYCRRAVDYRWSGAQALANHGKGRIVFGKLNVDISLFVAGFNRNFHPRSVGQLSTSDLPKELAAEIPFVELILDRYALLEKRDLERRAIAKAAASQQTGPTKRKPQPKAERRTPSHFASG